LIFSTTRTESLAGSSAIRMSAPLCWSNHCASFEQMFHVAALLSALIGGWVVRPAKTEDRQRTYCAINNWLRRTKRRCGPPCGERRPLRTPRQCSRKRIDVSCVEPIGPPRRARTFPSPRAPSNQPVPAITSSRPRMRVESTESWVVWPS